jgi:hypothetical protein
MAAPQTNGVLRTTLESMNIGDYIKCEIYKAPTSNIVFTSSFLGNLSTVDTESSTTPPMYVVGSTFNYRFFYLIKVDTGLLIADRLLFSNMSAQILNAQNYLLGKKLSDKCMMRCLSRAEFLKYISNSDLNGNIIKADANVWHGLVGTGANSTSLAFGNLYPEINQDRIGSNVKTSLYMDGSTYSTTSHVFMGGSALIPVVSGFALATFELSNGITSKYQYLSFRPALEYVDNSKSTNLYY